MTGRWTAQDAGIGGGVDSYYEYLVKGLWNEVLQDFVKLITWTHLYSIPDSIDVVLFLRLKVYAVPKDVNDNEMMILLITRYVFKLLHISGAILLEKPELMSMFLEARQSIDKYLRKDDWFVWATMLRGHVTLPVFQSLESYYPGLLSLIGTDRHDFYINKNNAPDYTQLKIVLK